MGDVWAWFDGKWQKVIIRNIISGFGYVVELYERPAQWYQVNADYVRRGEKPEGLPVDMLVGKGD